MELLQHPETHLQYKSLTQSRGHATWDSIGVPTNIHIFIDANDDPTTHVSTVIHELYHIILGSMFLGHMSDEMEEIGILAYEKDMYDYVSKSKERLARWNHLIKQKLDIPV